MKLWRLTKSLSGAIGNRATATIFFAVLLCIINSNSAAMSEKIQEKDVSNKANSIALSATMEEIPDDAIYIGDRKKIINPKCFDFKALISATPEFKEIKKRHLDEGHGKYWIYLSKANGRVHRQIEDFAKENDIQFVCTRKFLLPFIRKKAEYKDKDDDFLIENFDVTSQIIGKTDKSFKEKERHSENEPPSDVEKS